MAPSSIQYTAVRVQIRLALPPSPLYHRTFATPYSVKLPEKRHPVCRSLTTVGESYYYFFFFFFLLLFLVLLLADMVMFGRTPSPRPCDFAVRLWRWLSEFCGRAGGTRAHQGISEPSLCSTKHRRVMPGEGTVDGEVSSCVRFRQRTNIGDMSLLPAG